METLLRGELVDHLAHLAARPVELARIALAASRPVLLADVPLAEETSWVELAVQWGLPFYETSAKRGWHVNEVFTHLLSKMRKRYPHGQPKSRKRRRDQCVLM